MAVIRARPATFDGDADGWVDVDDDVVRSEMCPIGSFPPDNHANAIGTVFLDLAFGCGWRG